VVNDLTYEKAGEVLEQNPDGVLLVRDEMRGLLLHLAGEARQPRAASTCRRGAAAATPSTASDAAP
jgi:hypothetical protein